MKLDKYLGQGIRILHSTARLNPEEYVIGISCSQKIVSYHFSPQVCSKCQIRCLDHLDQRPGIVLFVRFVQMSEQLKYPETSQVLMDPLIPLSSRPDSHGAPAAVAAAGEFISLLYFSK